MFVEFLVRTYFLGQFKADKVSNNDTSILFENSFQIFCKNFVDNAITESLDSYG